MTKPFPRIIALCGPIGAGKTTVAQVLKRDFGYQRVRFAQPLKSMLKAIGLSDAQVDGDQKQTPSPLLCGQTPRHAMQTLGTEWGRALIGENIWVNAWKAAIEGKDCIVVDDLRFPNEEAAVRELGGRVWRVTRPGLVVNRDHASESHEVVADHTFVNNGTIRELEDCVIDYLAEVRGV